MTRTIAVMQGRLLPPVDDRIQAFPIDGWPREFELAAAAGVAAIEWTIDLDTAESHPMLGSDAYWVASAAKLRTGVTTPAVTCDFFMQLDLFSGDDPDFSLLTPVLLRVADSPQLDGDRTIVVPLVDQGRPRTADQWARTSMYFAEIAESVGRTGSRIAFEMDVDPRDQRAFVDGLDPSVFGINFDMGNSAARGFRPRDELSLIGGRVLHVHVKDRILGGATVPLGEGSADLADVAFMLEKIGYEGVMTLQVARIPDQPEVRTVAAYVRKCRALGLV